MQVGVGLGMLPRLETYLGLACVCRWANGYYSAVNPLQSVSLHAAKWPSNLWLHVTATGMWVQLNQSV
jgi:hypothetical protein